MMPAYRGSLAAAGDEVLRRRLAFVAVLLCGMCAPALADDSTDIAQCEDARQPDVAACTRIIEQPDPLRPQSILARAYLGRASVEMDSDGDVAADAAAKDADMAIQLDPNFARAHNIRGLIHQRKGDLDRAIAEYTKTIEINPAYSNAYANRGNVRQIQKDIDGAIEDFDAAIRANPKSDLAYYRRGLAYYAKKDWDHAISNFDVAIALVPAYGRDHFVPAYGDAYFGRASAYDAKGDLQRAIADYDQVIMARPDFARAYSRRANDHAQQGELDAALSDSSRVIDLDPNNAAPHAQRALIYRAQRERRRAMAEIDAAIALDNKQPGFYRLRGELSADWGDAVNAIKDLTEAIRLSTDDAQARIDRALAYFQGGDTDHAIDDLERAIDLDSKNGSAFFYLGVVQIYADAPSDAIASLTSAATLNPEDANIALWLEVASLHAGQAGRLASMSKQIDMTSWPAPIVELLLEDASEARLLASSESNDAAEKSARTCQSDFFAGQAALKRGALEDARRLFQTAVRICDNSQIERHAAKIEARRIPPPPETATAVFYPHDGSERVLVGTVTWAPISTGDREIAILGNVDIPELRLHGILTFGRSHLEETAANDNKPPRYGFEFAVGPPFSPRNIFSISAKADKESDDATMVGIYDDLKSTSVTLPLLGGDDAGGSIFRALESDDWLSIRYGGDAAQEIVLEMGQKGRKAFDTLIAGWKVHAREMQKRGADALATALADPQEGDEPDARLSAAIADLDEAIAAYPASADAFFDRARTHHAQGDLVATITDYTNALRLDPSNVAALVGRGAAYASAARIGAVDRVDSYLSEEALEDYRAAIKLNPSFADAYRLRGETRLDTKETLLAVADFDTALSLAPTSGMAFYDRGNAQRDLGDFDSAISDFNKAIGLLAGVELGQAYQQRGLTYRELRQYDLASADLHNAIERLGDRRGADALIAHGALLLQSGRYKEAANEFGRAASREHGRAYGWLALAHRADGNATQALADLYKRPTSQDDPYPTIWLSIELLRQKLDGPGPLFNWASDLDQQRKWTRVLVELFLGNGSPSKLDEEAEYARPEQKSEKRCEAHYYTGVFWLLQGSKETAHQLLQKAASHCSPGTYEFAAARIELLLTYGESN